MNKKIYIAVICAFSLLLTVSSGFLIKHYYDSHKQAKIYDSLAEIVDKTPDDTSEVMNYSGDKTFIPEYQELYLENNDMVGWIKIDDTKTNYGCPYVQQNCDMEQPSDNIVIYGHNMNDSSMFSALTKYKSKDFWESHKYIAFDTLTDKQNYEVIAAFKTVVYTDNADSFKYYQFVNAETAEEFNAYIGKCKELSLYDTGLNAEYRDKLITLSTCEYSRTNGRFVVVARLVKE